MANTGTGPEIASAHVAITAQFKNLTQATQQAINGSAMVMRSAGKSQGEAYGNQFSSAASEKINSALKNVFVYGGAYAAIGGLKQVFGAAADAIVGFNGRLEQTHTAFTTLLGSSSAATDQIATLEKFARETPFNFEDVTKYSQRLLAMGFDAQSLIPTLTDVGDAVSALGAGADGLDRVTYAIGQIRNSSHLMTQDMRQLTDVGINAWGILANKIGVSKQQVQDMTTAGLIPGTEAAQDLLDGFEKLFGGAMDAQSKTLLGTLSNIKDTLQQDLGADGVGAFNSLKDAAQDFMGWLNSPSGKGALKEFGDDFTIAVKAGVGFGKFLWDIHDALLAVGLAWGTAKIVGWVKELEIAKTAMFAWQAQATGAATKTEALGFAAGKLTTFRGAATAIGGATLAITALSGASNSAAGHVANLAATGALVGSSLGTGGAVIGGLAGLAKGLSDIGRQAPPAMKATADSIQHVIDTLGTLEQRQAASQFADLAKQLADLRQSLSLGGDFQLPDTDVKSFLTDMESGGKNAAKQLALAKQQLADIQANVKRDPGEWSGYASGIQKMVDFWQQASDAATVYGSAQGESSGQLADFASRLDKIKGLADFTDAAGSLLDYAKNAKGAFQSTTRDAADADGQLAQFAAAWAQLPDAARASTTNIQQASGAFIYAAEQMGDTRSQAVALAQQLLGLPKNIELTFTSNAEKEAERLTILGNIIKATKQLGDAKSSLEAGAINDYIARESKLLNQIKNTPVFDAPAYKSVVNGSAPAAASTAKTPAEKEAAKIAKQIGKLNADAATTLAGYSALANKIKNEKIEIKADPKLDPKDKKKFLADLKKLNKNAQKTLQSSLQDSFSQIGTLPTKQITADTLGTDAIQKNYATIFNQISKKRQEVSDDLAKHGLTKKMAQADRKDLAKLTAQLNDARKTALKNELADLAATAKQQLQSAQDAFNQMVSQYASGIQSSFDVTSYATTQDVVTRTGNAAAGSYSSGTATTSNLADILNGSDQAVANARTFSNDLTQLAKEGLDATTLGQLAAAGPSALPVVKELMKATPAQIKHLASNQNTINSLGTSLGTSLTNSLNPQGVASGVSFAQGILDGITSQQKLVNKGVITLTDSMVATFKKELGIASPSKVGINLGSNFGGSIGAGLLGEKRTVRDAASLVTAAMVENTQAKISHFAAPSAAPAAGQTGAPAVYVQNPFTGEYLLAQVSDVADGRISAQVYGLANA